MPKSKPVRKKSTGAGRKRAGGKGRGAKALDTLQAVTEIAQSLIGAAKRVSKPGERKAGGAAPPKRSAARGTKRRARKA